MQCKWPVNWLSGAVQEVNYHFGWSLIVVCHRSLVLPYLTLPYREDVLPPSAEAYNRPNALHELTIRLQNPQVQYTPGSIPTLGTIHLSSDILLTWTYLLTCTLGISKRISARKHINTSILVTMTCKTPNQENPGDPSLNQA